MICVGYCDEFSEGEIGEFSIVFNAGISSDITTNAKAQGKSIAMIRSPK
uniref:Uncharacterized protein n=1 Tax=Planktothrix agardhii TaxID=1160 RepID=A0A1J1JDB0_PLAAG|nr:protein of unknown function [Planktothrix agardhii]